MVVPADAAEFAEWLGESETKAQTAVPTSAALTMEYGEFGNVEDRRHAQQLALLQEIRDLLQALVKLTAKGDAAI